MSQEPIKKSEAAEREEQILKFWQENKIFEKTLEKPSSKGNFVFYDGPPFATGLPHYGHILAGTIKDVIPRYKTMLGHSVRRVWGWDCHGLPIENMIEKELGLQTKKDIEKYGIENFNKAARESVLRYEKEWKNFIPRVGRWVDMENSYKTMDSSYTESVWWSFKKLFEKGLVYEGFKSMHLCPRCGTTLSNFEVNQGYKDITDISVYVKFELVDEPNTFLIAWTTTPWTLPGNAALAINPDIEYVKYLWEGSNIIVAKKFFDNGKYPGLDPVYISGKDLIGKKYKPPFGYYLQDETLKNKENAWKVYGAPFVTIEDGTGIVHIAPSFGEDDLNLALDKNIPIIQHVNQAGEFKAEVVDFTGTYVKPKDDHQKADIEIIKHLAHKNLLFGKEKIIHSYPHCWRCDTPLLNYATSSWFVKVTDLKDKMVALNKSVKWVPEEIGENRFGKWLEGARDWAVSRSRYWGAPLPVWRNEKGDILVLGSVEELKGAVKKSGNQYFTLRHGEAEQNLKDLINSDLSNNIYHLTEDGKKQISASIEQIKKENIDLIITSPFLRCKEAAEMTRVALGLDKSCVLEDERLVEFKKGPGFEGKGWNEYWGLFSSMKERFEKSPDGGENLNDLNKRAGELLYDLENKYSGKNILVVTHQGVIAAMHMIAQGADRKGFIKAKENKTYTFGLADFRKLDFVPLPHNENYELDLHRPYIDDVKIVDAQGNILSRVDSVFDTWYDSGSMPYAQSHYPFNNREEFENKNSQFFPADFIAEGLDQTRGWFYTLLVLSTGVFEKSPFRNVIVNGIVLAQDGQKMSKKLKNYPDPMSVIDRYGADSLRYYLVSSSVVRAEDLAFSEKGLDEVYKKLILRLGNVFDFYLMYKGEGGHLSDMSKNILDKWIVSRLNEMGRAITVGLEKYELDRASRPILDFVDDLSTWYIRRSRDRFKSDNAEDKNNALVTTKYILTELSKYIAPFMPFFAEYMYQQLRNKENEESVHFCEWPKQEVVDEKLLADMVLVRRMVSEVLMARNGASIKVRQPLSKLKIQDGLLEDKPELVDLIKDEINVKEIIFDRSIESSFYLDTVITPELKKEGMERDVIRFIQELRKVANLNPSDSKKLSVDTDEEGKRFIEEAAQRIKIPTNISDFIFEANEAQENFVENMKFKFKIV